MAALTLTEEEYRDKVLGAWMGKSIGVTLGAPWRGSKIPGRQNFYSPVPGQPASSLALDFSMVWLKVMEQAGADVLPEDLAVAWLEHLDYSQDEFGYAALNLRRGLPPPASGAYSNWFRHSTGGAMRADFWAMIAPGSPQTAAAYAYYDTALDHSEEGQWAAMFLAAVGSAAFFLHDPLTLITIGLAMIPRTCRTARGVKAGLAAAHKGGAWLEARETVLKEVGSDNFTDVAQNLGFVTIGLFYGNDFGSSLCAGVNCGCDTEFIGAALGAIQGIQRGRARLPEEWTRPINDLLIPGGGVRDFDAPDNLHEAAERTVIVGKAVIAAKIPDVEIAVAGAGLSSPAALAFVSELEPESPSTSEPMPAVLSEPEGVSLSPETLPPLFDSVPQASPFEEEGETLAPPPPLFDDLPSPPQTVEPFAPVTVPSEIASPVSESSNVPADAVLPASSAQPVAEPTAETIIEDTGASSVGFVPQPVSADEPIPIVQGETAVNPLGASAAILPSAPDLANAIAWADSTQVKPLLITPPNAMMAQAGNYPVVVDTGDAPAIAYGIPKTLSFTIQNPTGEAFNGRVALLVPSGWQVMVPQNFGTKQFIAANTGILRVDFTVVCPEGSGRIDIANAVTLRLTPENGSATSEAEFALMGASCWWCVGPFANFDGEGFDRTYLPENRPGLAETYFNRLSQSVRWEKRSFAESFLNLETLFKQSSGVCYGQTVLRTPTSRPARIVVNSNSGVKLWLNGQLALRRFNKEPFRPIIGSGNWAVDVMLNAGDNPIMVKWVRGAEPYQFSLTVADRYGRGLPEVGNTSW